jgi:hypothetical protein
MTILKSLINKVAINECSRLERLLMVYFCINLNFAGTCDAHEGGQGASLSASSRKTGLGVVDRNAYYAWR